MAKGKGGIGLMIALGKPSGPPPRYKASPDKFEEAHPAPGEKGGDPAPPKDPDAGRPEQDAEIAEPAMHKAQEGMGDMMAGVMAPLLEAGASEEQAKEILGKMFTAMARCMGGKAESDEAQGAPERPEGIC
jgi:hypothetical protein